MEPQTTFSPQSDQPLQADERSTAMWMHLAPLIAMFVNMLIPIPLLSLITVGILYYTQKDKSAFIARHGKESLNFQITLFLVGVVMFIVFAVVFGGSILGIITGADNGDLSGVGAAGLVGGGLALGGVALLIGLGVAVLLIIAAMRANSGQNYRYPVSLRLVK
ncbi:MAG: DUF4870 domain-containing protein [Cytophagaceae bacterium]|nr:DUF4870 domain-containing protein [Cytophagaceae bacterium]